ncbi:ATP-binding cassette domain-containing protein [Polyangium aurulentum]|uniref:ATP-binding cassette domain-containing protein n=1 Tax=Polyangium aurulentum TaxID=2567896 RepID=UPI0010AE8681|nr:ATP-binding cassette domain-containing protein [Polyangium aurulentum]UQA63092.1 ATP-binding cassette domain-containing protein [Polyangium aurulentum]
MSDTPAIEVEKLEKRFGDVEAVRGVSFSVPHGEIFGFLGPNGAGKTTTIKMLCTLLEPSGGKARLGGFDVTEEPGGVRKSIGVIFQDPALDDRLSAVENLELHAVVYDVPRAERRARIDEALGFVELSDRKNDIVRHFSGGMKRRLEIARGLLHRPRVLFLDEPTTGLDPQTRRRTWEVLRSLRDRYGTTLFLTTHYMDEAEHCDRIAIIDHGRIVAEGTPEELKRKVGKDVVTVRTSEPEPLRRLLEERHGIVPEPTEDGLSFRVEEGEAFIVELVAEARVPLSGIAVHRPTLDDVFLALTGRQIREENGNGSKEALRAIARRR